MSQGIGKSCGALLPLMTLAGAMTLGGCGSSDSGPAASSAMNGEALARDVEAVVLEYFDSRGVGWTIGSVTCEDIPSVDTGAIADCQVDLDEEHVDDFSVRVTMQDKAGHFEWESSGLTIAGGGDQHGGTGG